MSFIVKLRKLIDPFFLIYNSEVNINLTKFVFHKICIFRCHIGEPAWTCFNKKMVSSGTRVTVASSSAFSQKNLIFSSFFVKYLTDYCNLVGSCYFLAIIWSIQCEWVFIFENEFLGQTVGQILKCCLSFYAGKIIDSDSAHKNRAMTKIL